MNGNTWLGWGRLTRDPEARTTESGMVIANFSIAIDRQRGGADHPQADFFRCTAFQKCAEFILSYFKKGMRIAITGRLQNRDWEQDGVKHRITEIIVENANFLDTKAVNEAIVANSGGGGGAYASQGYSGGGSGGRSGYARPEDVPGDGGEYAARGDNGAGDDDDALPF
jgi:single-strand DNA-binding protein